VQLADQVEALDAAAKLAAARLQEARTALDLEREAECSANATFDADGTEASLEQASRAGIRRARAERVHVARAADLEVARRALADVQREAQRALYKRATGQLDAWQGGLRREVKELVDLDRELADVVERIADQVADAEAVWREAAELAREIGEEVVFKSRFRVPTLDAAQYIARVGIDVARTRDHRADFDGWLDGEKLPGVHESQETWHRAARLVTAEDAHAQ
jgi:hypothetical protein